MALNMPLGKNEAQRPYVTLCPQLAMLCLDLRPKTADVRVLTGLWQFRMIQGTQLPVMRSFHTAEPGWPFPTSPFPPSQIRE